MYSERNKAFGYGRKTDLDIGKNRHNVIPASTTYDLRSFVETNKAHKKGFTPRYSRDVLELFFRKSSQLATSTCKQEKSQVQAHMNNSSKLIVLDGH